MLVSAAARGISTPSIIRSVSNGGSHGEVFDRNLAIGINPKPVEKLILRGVLSKPSGELKWAGAEFTEAIKLNHRHADEGAILEHARQGGFPATRISEVKTVIDPTTAEDR